MNQCVIRVTLMSGRWMNGSSLALVSETTQTMSLSCLHLHTQHSWRVTDSPIMAFFPQLRFAFINVRRGKSKRFYSWERKLLPWRCFCAPPSDVNGEHHVPDNNGIFGFHTGTMMESSLSYFIKKKKKDTEIIQIIIIKKKHWILPFLDFVWGCLFCCNVSGIHTSQIDYNYGD